MSPAPLTPAQAAALRRARELVGELAALVAIVRATLAAQSAPAPEPARAEPEPEPADSALAPGEMRAAFAAAATGIKRRPRELFGG